MSCEHAFKMPLPILAKKVKKLASLHILNIKLLLNGRGISKFKKQYRLKGELGQGGFGVVYRAIRISDSLPVAVKFIERRHVREWGKLNNERVPMEICMLARCSKIFGVIKLLDWFNLPEGFLIVMERPSSCIDLFDFIHNQHFLQENLARFIFRQVVQTAYDCAERKVLHRDIKDENVVIDLVSGETRLIDFGAATLLKKTRYHDFQGTRLYCPPEWFLHSLYLGKEATVWSLGILLYNMLNGRLPFHNEKDICTAHLLGPLPFFTKLSLEARNLIEKCLSFDPFVRPSLENILKDEWMWLETFEWYGLNPTRFASSQSCEDISSMESFFADLDNDNSAKLPKMVNAVKLQLKQKQQNNLINNKNCLQLNNQNESLNFQSSNNKVKVDKEKEQANKMQSHSTNREHVESGLISSGSAEHDEEESEEDDYDRDVRRTEEYDCCENGECSDESCKKEAEPVDKENLRFRHKNRIVSERVQANYLDKPNTSNAEEREKLKLAVRRNAKTSVMKSPGLKLDEIYGISDNNYSESFVISKNDLTPKSLKHRSGLLKNKEGSFDSGTSSALASPKNVPISPYAF